MSWDGFKKRLPSSRDLMVMVVWSVAFVGVGDKWYYLALALFATLVGTNVHAQAKPESTPPGFLPRSLDWWDIVDPLIKDPVWIEGYGWAIAVAVDYTSDINECPVLFQTRIADLRVKRHDVESGEVVVYDGRPEVAK
jgi:hypothetical protein